MEEKFRALGEVVKALRGLAALQAEVAALLRRSWRLADTAARAAARVGGIVVPQTGEALPLLSGRAGATIGELEVEVDGPLLSLRWISVGRRGIREIDLRAVKLSDITFAAALERLNPGLLEQVAAELALRGGIEAAKAVEALERAVELFELAFK